VEQASVHALSQKHTRQIKYAQEIHQIAPDDLMIGDYDVLLQNAIEKCKGTVVGRCPLCCQSFESHYQLLQHVSSRKHRENLTWFQRIHAAKALGKFMSSMSRDYRMGGRSSNDLSTYDKILPHSNFIISDEIVSFIHNLPHGIVVREWEYFCVLCDVQLASEDAVMRHAQSGQHSNVRYNRRGNKSDCRR
jgi:hypothetical protein